MNRLGEGGGGTSYLVRCWYVLKVYVVKHASVANVTVTEVSSAAYLPSRLKHILILRLLEDATGKTKNREIWREKNKFINCTRRVYCCCMCQHEITGSAEKENTPQFCASYAWWWLLCSLFQGYIWVAKRLTRETITTAFIYSYSGKSASVTSAPNHPWTIQHRDNNTQAYTASSSTI